LSGGCGYFGSVLVGRLLAAGQRVRILDKQDSGDRPAAAGLDVTIVRPYTIMGPQRLGVWQILFEAVRTGRSVFVFGQGDNRYQFIHADDLAEACLKAAARPRTRRL